MIHNYYSFQAYREEDVLIILKSIANAQIESIATISNVGKCTTIEFTLEHFDYSVKSAIENHFKDYEFTNDLGNGRKEIRIKYSLVQAPFSTDDWGRPLEHLADETLYLIKKSKKKEKDQISRTIGVLFDDKIVYYYINMVHGIIKESDKKGYLLKRSFGEDDYKNDEIKAETKRLYKTKLEAFHEAKGWIEEQAKSDYENFKNAKKRQERRKKK